MDMIALLFKLLVCSVIALIIIMIVLFMIGVYGNIKYNMKKYDLTFSECIGKFISEVF